MRLPIQFSQFSPRTTASGFANTGARLASVLSPLMIAIPVRLQPIVTVTVGVLTIVVTALAYFCPETKGISVLTSVDEAVVFYKTGKVATSTEDLNNNTAEWTAMQKKEAQPHQDDEVLIRDFSNI